MSSTTLPSKCCFNGCSSPVLSHGKCKLHRYRHHCSVPHCMNQAYARRLCVAHGGRRECLSPGCLGNARSRGYCCKHSDDHHSKVITTGELSPLPARDRCSSSSFPMERRGAPSSPAVAEPPNDKFKAEGDDATTCLKLIEVEAMKFVQCWDDFEIDVIDGFLSDLPMSSMMWSMQ